MHTSSERRKMIFDLADRPNIGPSARALARKGREIMDRHADRMACLMGTDTPDLGGKTSASVVALVKPVGDSCNLRCRYCFNHPEQPLRTMTPEMMNRVVSQVLETCHGGATFILHGGEPLLAGLDFFKEFRKAQERYRRPGQWVKNFVTTNGTLLNGDWGQFFLKHDFRIGVSIDGPPEVHDANRVDRKGQGSMDRVLAGIRATQDCGMDVSAISVVTHPPAVTPVELYDYISSLGIRQWRANPCRSPETVEGYGPYVEELFDLWTLHDGQANIGIISEILEGLFGFTPQVCWMKGSCHKFLGFDPDGSVSPCCEMTLDPMYRFGNIREQKLRDILEGQVARRFWSLKSEGDRHCDGCEWTQLCKGGCTYHRLQFGGDPSGSDYLCEAYKDAFRRVASRVDTILGGVSSTESRHRGEFPAAGGYG